MSKQNSKNGKNAQTANVQTSNVETPNASITDVSNAPDAINVDGLEKADTLTKHVASENAPQFKDVEFLTTANPADFHVNENISTKYDKEREDKVFVGLELIKNVILASGNVTNPLLILLGKWWEVKPARSGIKALIDAEATAKGYPSDVYMQIELKKQIDELSELQTAIDRMRYSLTYFKPRKPLSNKVPMQQISIDKVYYSVATSALVEAKAQFGEDKEALKAHILSIAIPADTLIEEL